MKQFPRPGVLSTPTGVFRILQRGWAWRATPRAYNGGLGAEPPAWSRGRAAGQGVRGEAPLKLKHLDVQWKWQICPLLQHLETPKNTDISVVSPKENISHKYATGTQNIVSNRPNLLIDKHSGRQSNDRYKLQRKTDYQFWAWASSTAIKYESFQTIIV